MTLEEYFRKNLDHNIIDHSLRVEISKDNIVYFYVHPDGVDGDTLDFSVHGNNLIQILFEKILPEIKSEITTDTEEQAVKNDTARGIRGSNEKINNDIGVA